MLCFGGGAVGFDTGGVFSICFCAVAGAVADVNFLGT